MNSQREYFIDRFCRLCLSECETCIYIFEHYAPCREMLAQVFEDLMTTRISEDDGYPRIVCLDCCKKLNEFFVLRNQCDLTTLPSYLLFKNQYHKAQSAFDYAINKEEDNQHSPISEEHSPLSLSLEDIGSESENENQSKGLNAEDILKTAANILRNMKCKDTDIMSNNGRPVEKKEDISKDKQNIEFGSVKLKEKYQCSSSFGRGKNEETNEITSDDEEEDKTDSSSSSCNMEEDARTDDEDCFQNSDSGTVDSKRHKKTLPNENENYNEIIENEGESERSSSSSSYFEGIEIDNEDENLRNTEGDAVKYINEDNGSESNEAKRHKGTSVVKPISEEEIESESMDEEEISDNDNFENAGLEEAYKCKEDGNNMGLTYNQKESDCESEPCSSSNSCSIKEEPETDIEENNQNTESNAVEMRDSIQSSDESSNESGKSDDVIKIKLEPEEDSETDSSITSNNEDKEVEINNVENNQNTESNTVEMRDSIQSRDESSNESEKSGDVIKIKLEPEEDSETDSSITSNNEDKEDEIDNVENDKNNECHSADSTEEIQNTEKSTNSSEINYDTLKVKVEPESESDSSLDTFDANNKDKTFNEEACAESADVKEEPPDKVICSSKNVQRKGFERSVAPDEFKCGICGKLCKSKSGMRLHINWHLREGTNVEKEKQDAEVNKKKGNLKARKKKVDSKISKKTAGFTVRKLKKESDFQCSECKKVFKVKWDLLRHEVIHSNIKEFKCDICGREFTHKRNLKVHYKRHVGYKPFECTQCGKRFYDSTSLNSHKVTHSTEKPFRCTRCDKNFASRMLLKLHGKVHDGIKPIVCNVCGLRFTQRCDLKKHQVVHTGEKNFECSECGRKFAHKRNLKSHQEIHIKRENYKCDKCGKSFLKKLTLQRHLFSQCSNEFSAGRMERRKRRVLKVKIDAT